MMVRMLVAAASLIVTTSALSCELTKTCNSTFPGVYQFPLDSGLQEEADHYAQVLAIYDIVDDWLLVGDEDDGEGDTDQLVLIRGHSFSVESGRYDGSATKIEAVNEAARDDVLVDLTDAGFGSLLKNLTLPQHMAPDSVAFVAWLSEPERVGPELLRTSSSKEATMTLMLPLVVGEQSHLAVKGRSDEGDQTLSFIELTTEEAILLEHDKVLYLPQQNEDHPEATCMVLLISLKPINEPYELPTSPFSLQQDFRNNTLSFGEIEPVRWARSGKVASTGGCYRVGLPETFGPNLMQHFVDMGIVAKLEHLLYDDPLQIAWINQMHTFGKESEEEEHQWYVERPGEFDIFDMLFFVPANVEAHVHALKVLADSGFDEIIASVAEHFGWKHAMVSHVSLLGISAGDHALTHSDFYDTGNKAFNILVPLKMVDPSEPELLVDTDDMLRGQLKYKMHEGVMVGDNCYHATKAIDYRDRREFRFFAGLYIAQVDEENAEMATPTYYKMGYPHHDHGLTLQNAGAHWDAKDGKKKLPTF